MAVSRMTSGKGLKKIFKRLEDLPAPPPVATKILSRAMDENSSIAEISRLVEMDQSLTLRVLRQANSAAHGLTGRVTSVEHAAAILGFPLLRNIVLGVYIRESLVRDERRSDPQLTALWKHSLACAVASELVAGQIPDCQAGVAFGSGLVHDCGRIAMLSVMPREYEHFAEDEGSKEFDPLERERDIFGVDHTIAGKWILEKWDMPAALTEAVWLHHHPPEMVREMAAHGSMVLAVSLGNLLAHEIMVDYVRPDFMVRRNAIAKELGLTEAVVETVKAGIGGQYAERAAAFDLDQDEVRFYYEALQRANRRLVSYNSELDRSFTDMRRFNKALEAVGQAGLDLARERDAEGVFRTAAAILAESLGALRGVVYLADRQGGMLEGATFGFPDGPRELSCRLDESGVPIFSRECRIPEELKSVVGQYQSRIPEDMAFNAIDTLPGFLDPFFFVPLVGEEGCIGEMIFVLEPGASRGLKPHEYLCFSQLANMIGATLARLALHGELEDRAERLSVAMRKMQQIHLKLLQTERLAAVGQLAAGAAHEINNPLAIIYARTQLLEIKEEDEKKGQVLRLIMGQIERISKILNNLMDFARPAPPQMIKVDVNSVLEKTLNLVESGFKKKNIEINSRLARELPPIKGDPHQLEQVFLNLCINAEHAMEDSGGTLTLQSGLSSRGDCVTVTVRDTGVGIDKEHLPRIFDPFFTTKEEGKGTGLGLSTSYGIVSSHEGDITINSEPGRGTEVTVVLPLERKMPMTTSKREKGPSGDAQPRGILVVDDEQHIREVLREALEAEGMRVVSAGNGQEALEILAKSRFRLAILDIRMPRKDGLSLLTQIRQKISSMPVIILTGLASHEEMEKARQLGAAKCLRKPFQVDQLVAEVKDVLENRPPSDNRTDN